MVDVPNYHWAPHKHFMRKIRNEVQRLISINKIRHRFDQLKETLRKSVATTSMLQLNRTCYPNDEKINSLFREHKVNGSEVSTLDLGSGPNPKNPFNATSCLGVDIRANETQNVVYADLAKGILPFPDKSFNYVTAYDVLEHIPRIAMSDGNTSFPFIQIMNEIFRVLKPDGIFFSMHPCYPAKEVFQDPTHVNIMSEDTMDFYFCERAWARIYGYEGSFLLVEDGWIGYKYFSFLKKSNVKPIRDLEFVQK